jgi:SAM-dependent methyltransferase
MHSDFRTSLYDNYVSAFKGEPCLSAEPSFAWWDHKYLPLLKDVDRAAPVLDIGCGSGGLLAYLQRRGFSRARGIDVSVEQVERARQRGVEVERADALTYLAMHQSEFAAIVAVDVFEHFERAETMDLAQRIYAALQPRGRLLVQTANGAGLFPRQVIYGDLTHLTIFTPESIGQLLRPIGFGEMRVYEAGPIPLRIRGRIDVALWAAIKMLANTVRSVETGKRQSIWTENFICTAIKPL